MKCTQTVLYHCIKLDFNWILTLNPLGISHTFSQNIMFSSAGPALKPTHGNHSNWDLSGRHQGLLLQQGGEIFVPVYDYTEIFTTGSLCWGDVFGLRAVVSLNEMKAGRIYGVLSLICHWLYEKMEWRFSVKGKNIKVVKHQAYKITQVILFFSFDKNVWKILGLIYIGNENAGSFHISIFHPLTLLNKVCFLKLWKSYSHVFRSW